MSQLTSSQPANKKKRSTVRKAQITVGAIGALISFLGTMPLPESWFPAHSASSTFFFLLFMYLALPAYTFSKLLGPDAQHATDPVSFGWGICIYITVFNTVLCVLAGTVLGFVIKVLKTHFLKK